MRNDTRKIILLSLFSIGITLAGIETLARLYEYLRKTPELLQPSRGYSPLLTYYNLPNIRSPRVNTNSMGYRGVREVSMPKPANTFRVFMVGASQVSGEGASSDETTVTGYLERALQKENKGLKIEVFNAGCAGFISVQELVLITTQIIDFSPDLIVVMDGFVDLYDASFKHWKPDTPMQGVRVEKLISHLPPWYLHLASARVARGFIYRDLPEGKCKHPSDLLIQVYLKNLSKISRIAREFGVSTVLVLEPALAVSSKKLTAEEKRFLETSLSNECIQSGYQRVRAEMQKMSLPSEATFLDLSDAFTQSNEPIFTDVVHLTDLGNKHVAQQISRHIMKRILSNFGH